MKQENKETGKQAKQVEKLVKVAEKWGYDLGEFAELLDSWGGEMAEVAGKIQGILDIACMSATKQEDLADIAVIGENYYCVREVVKAFEKM